MPLTLWFSFLHINSFIEIPVPTLSIGSLAVIVCTTLYKGIFLLFGTSTSSSIRSFSNTFHLPYVTLGLGGVSAVPQLSEGTRSGLMTDDSSRKNQFSLYLRPAAYGAVLDVIRFYGWKKIIFIYDTIDGKKINSKHWCYSMSLQLEISNWIMKQLGWKM